MAYKIHLSVQAMDHLDELSHTNRGILQTRLHWLAADPYGAGTASTVLPTQRVALMAMPLQGSQQLAIVFTVDDRANVVEVTDIRAG